MNRMPIQPPTREDQLIFQGLQRAVVENKAYIRINFRLLNRRGSPFFNPWENVLPLLVLLTISLIVMALESLIVGTALLLVLSLAYAFLMPFLLEPVMQNRVVKRIVPRIERFLIAWRYGGIVLVLTADSHFFCVAPWGDWREFTKNYFSDLIPADAAAVVTEEEEEENA